ncbi:MAG: hypothetical protein ABI376_09120 [Caulobacteraceae bacterium]
MAKPRSPLARDLFWRLEALGYDLFTALVRAAPTDAVSAVGGWLLRRLGPLSSAHKTAGRSLRLAFPDMADAERRRILGDQWENFGRYIAEFPILDRLTPAGAGSRWSAASGWRRSPPKASRWSLYPGTSPISR